MGKIIALANFKGGVGKTTSAINIGAGLANKGKKVLLVDMDQQFNLTQSLGINKTDSSIYDSLIHNEPLNIINITKKLFLTPSSLQMIKADIEINDIPEREFLLSKLIEPIKNEYDYIIIDCPPSLGLVTINALIASDYIFIPIEAQYLALKGFTILKDAISSVGLNVNKVFITKYYHRKTLNKHVAESIKKNLKDKVFNTYIRDNIALAEAPTKGLDIFRYDKDSPGAEDYKRLCNEILKEFKHSK